MRKKLAIGLLLTTSACAEQTSIYHTRGIPAEKARVVTIDAKQRSIFIVPTATDDDDDEPNPKKTKKDAVQNADSGNGKIAKPDDDSTGTKKGKKKKSDKEERRSLFRMCAEAAPDAFSALSASGSLAADVKSQSGNAAVALAETAGTIERTQTINLLRESMYRTCERYLSGALKRRQLIIQAARDQKSMIAVLAIEQLTRAARAPAIILTPMGTSSVVGNGAEQAALIAGLSKERADAKKALDEAAADYDKVKANCVAPTIPVEGATSPTPEEWANCNKARSAASDRSKEYDAATARLDRILAVIPVAGIAAGAATTGLTPQGGGGGGTPDQATLRQIAQSVEKIALGSRIDEALMFCITSLGEDNPAKHILDVCDGVIKRSAELDLENRMKVFYTSSRQDGDDDSRHLDAARGALTEYVASSVPAAELARRWEVLRKAAATIDIDRDNVASTVKAGDPRPLKKLLAAAIVTETDPFGRAILAAAP